MALNYSVCLIIVFFFLVIYNTFFSLEMTNNIHNYNVNELHDWLQDRPTGAHFVDVRELSELEEQGTIEGYDSNIPYFMINTNPELFKEKFSVYDRDEQIVISCRSGRRSLLTAKFIVENMEFKNVYNVQGGILEWISHGYPVKEFHK